MLNAGEDHPLQHLLCDVVLAARVEQPHHTLIAFGRCPAAIERPAAKLSGIISGRSRRLSRKRLMRQDCRALAGFLDG
jgi:hypothetical protein